MCWNQEVSLNTFVFSSLVLLLIIYNNQYTKYKIPELNDFWICMFLFSFIFMQLVEFFIWRNIDNPFYNKLFTICAVIVVLFIQPIVSLMMIKNSPTLRNNLIVGYIIFLTYYFFSNYLNFDFHSKVSKQGHLIWRFNDRGFKWNALYLLVWLFFFLFSLFYNKNIFGLLFAIVTICIAIYNYLNDKTVSSMWCWFANGMMLYYAAFLLIYLPFIKN